MINETESLVGGLVDSDYFALDQPVVGLNPCERQRTWPGRVFGRIAVVEISQSEALAAIIDVRGFSGSVVTFFLAFGGILVQ